MSRGEIFVSYHNEDIHLARKVKKQFEAYGWSAFLASDDIRPSESWRDEILRHIDSCSVLIAVVTPRTTQSAWMNQEVGIAKGKGKRIISLLFGRSGDLPGFLESIQGIFASKDDVVDAVRKANNAISEVRQEPRESEHLELEKSFPGHSQPDLEKRSFVVYFDEDYPNSFIGYEEGRRLASYLTERGFSQIDALQLQEWILNVIKRGMSQKTSLVFAMDIIPETIFGDVDANVAFRKYLDLGGRVIWIGDVPAWYKGQSQRKRIEVWQLGSCVSLLGIAPVIANCMKSVNLTSRGRELGLRSEWYSMRPIVVTSSSDSTRSAISREPVFVLAWTEVNQGNYVFRPPRRNRRLRNISIQMLGFGFGAELESNQDEGRIHNETCASAWHMVFNEVYPDQGFFRIWDHPVRLDDLSETKLQELYNIAIRNLS